MHVGQSLRGGNGTDNVRKNIDALLKLSYPDEAEKVERRAEEVKKMLEREVSRGPLQFKVVDDGGRKAAKRRRRKKT